jgi:membrane-associated phospholipid phosphatase
MQRILIALTVAGVAVVAWPRYSYPGQVALASQTDARSPASPINAVIEWNRALLTIVRTPGANPATIHPTRSFAIMHAAIFDAVNAIQGSHKGYLVRGDEASPGASQEAAAAAAAGEVLEQLYPAFKATTDAQLQVSLARIRNGLEKTDGIAIGMNAADQILALRADDGSGSPVIPYVFGTRPGDYQSTPPNFPSQPVFTHWPGVTPFVLRAADQFRPGPPPRLTTRSYAIALNEVKALGVENGTASSPDQALTARFWNGPIQNYWNEIAQTTAMRHNLTTADTARLFALLNLTLADSVIAFYDAKYAYNFWRPVTAIRSADLDDNGNTLAETNWLPEVGNTPPDPSYPGAHAVISDAAATVLIAFFDTDQFEFDVTSETLAGVTRSFDSFSAAAREAGLSRIFAGVHFRFDEVAGGRLGQTVAHFVLTHTLKPRPFDK